jgi:hypothetical protein
MQGEELKSGWPCISELCEVFHLKLMRYLHMSYMVADFRGMIEPYSSMISVSRTELLSSIASPLICPLRL